MNGTCKRKWIAKKCLFTGAFGKGALFCKAVCFYFKQFPVPEKMSSMTV